MGALCPTEELEFCHRKNLVSLCCGHPVCQMLSAELLTPAFCSWEWGSLILSNQGETLDDSPRTSSHFLYGFSYFSSCGSDHFLHMVLPWSLASVSWNCTLYLMSLPQTWSWFILIAFFATSERCPTLNCFSCRPTHDLEFWNKQTNKQMLTFKTVTQALPSLSELHPLQRQQAGMVSASVCIRVQNTDCW